MNNALQQNPFFSGGLTLMVVGAVMALLRNLPTTLWGLVVHWFTISVEIPDRDPAFRWVQSWIVEQTHARRARSLSLTTTWADPDPDPTIETNPEYACSTSGRVSAARFVLSPAPGTHVMKYRGRLLLVAAGAARPDERRDDGVPGDVDAPDHRRQPRADRRPAEGSAHDGAAQDSRGEHPDGAA